MQFEVDWREQNNFLLIRNFKCEVIKGKNLFWSFFGTLKINPSFPVVVCDIGVLSEEYIKMV